MAARMDPEDGAQTVAVLMWLAAKSPEYQRTYGNLLAAPHLLGPPTSRRYAVAAAALAGCGHSLARLTVAAVGTRPAGCRFSDQQLVDLLKMPTCSSTDAANLPRSPGGASPSPLRRPVGVRARRRRAEARSRLHESSAAARSRWPTSGVDLQGRSRGSCGPPVSGRPQAGRSCHDNPRKCCLTRSAVARKRA